MQPKRPKIEVLPEDTPWGIQPEETESHYRYFLEYLQQAPPRSIQRLAEGKDKAATTLYGYSRRFMWLPRTRAYDAWEAEKIIETTVEEKARYRREHLRALELARLLAEIKLQQMHENPIELIESMSARDAIEFLTKAVQQERLIIGEATERAELQTKVDVSKLTDDELEQYEYLTAKCTADDDEE